MSEETGIAGFGTLVAESREVSSFDSVLFESEGSVIITVGDDPSVSIETDDNLQQYLEASVVGNALTVSTSTGVDIAPSAPPVFRVGVTELAAVSLGGAGAIEVDTLDSERFEITLAGAGEIAVGSISVDGLAVDLRGAGVVSVTGTAEKQDLFVGGVAVYEASELESRAVAIKASGSGQATIWTPNRFRTRHTVDATSPRWPAIRAGPHRRFTRRPMIRRSVR